MKLNPAYVGLTAKAVSRIDDMTGLPDPVVKVFIDEESLEQAASQITEDSEHMLSRLAQIEDHHPAMQELEDVIRYSFPEAQGLSHLAEQAQDNHHTAERSLDDVNGIGTVAEFVALLAGSGALAAEGISLPAGVVLAAKAGLSLKEMVERVQDAQSQVEDLSQWADRLHWTRQEFDLVWDRHFSEDSALEAAPAEI